MEHNTAAVSAGGPDLDTPLTVHALVEAESIGSNREVYEAIYDGMPHFRRGRAIRVTRRQWRDWWAAGHVPAGTYQPDPVRSERARRRAMERGE